MAFLIVAGVAFDALTTGVRELAPVEIGKSRRAFAGNLRSSVRSVKRVWAYTSRDMTDAEIATLQAAAPHGSYVVCSGDSLPGSATYEVTYKGGQHVESGNPYYKRVLEMQVQQV